jgi:hypothetical protein
MVAAPRFTPLLDHTERLYPRCLFCRGAFPRSALFERVPPGACLAYDPERGRIWSVCERCSRWNLIPLDERFDAVDELERVIRDRAVSVATTANVALYEVDDLAIVRLGPASLVEHVAWRYGRELIARGAVFQRRRTRFNAFTAGALARAGEALGAWKLDRYWGPSDAADILRWQRFGSVAWTGRTPCPFCASVLHTLHFDSSWWLYPRIESGRLVVGVPCTRCDPWTPRNVFDVTDEDAEIVLRRVLAYQHVAGASERAVTNAATLIEHAGSADRLLRDLSSGRRSLWGLGAVRTLALEIAVNHLAEQRERQARLVAWEAAWRIEEPLARIVDDELS